MSKIFFDNWDALIRTGVISVLAYISIVFLLRISGRRTLSKMNAFDFVVTIALGSTLATVLLNKNTSLAQGFLAFASLIFMQFIVTWASVRLSWVKSLVTGEPALLFYEGNYLPEAMKKARVTKEEIQTAIRSSGQASMASVHAVVLETDGSFSVVSSAAGSGASSLDQLNNRIDSAH